MSHHIRNPVNWHEDEINDQFVMIPNELARDTELTHHAYRIAIEIRTHMQGYEVSAAGIASAHRWSRGRVGKAIEELVAARWLAVRRYETASGGRIFDEYHVHRSRRFTEAEMVELCTPVVLSSRPVAVEATLVSLEDAGGWAEADHPPVFLEDTKEEQLEDNSKDQLEDQRSDCWICNGSGWDSGEPCGNCNVQNCTPRLASTPWDCICWAHCGVVRAAS